MGRFWVALAVLLAASTLAQGRHTVELGYQRSGGVAGLREGIVVRAGALEVFERGARVGGRALSAEEEKSAEALHGKLVRASAPKVRRSEATDAFRVTLSVDGAEKLSESAETLPIAGAGKEWDEAVRWLDGLLTRELRRLHPERPKVLSPDEL